MGPWTKISRKNVMAPSFRILRTRRLSAARYPRALAASSCPAGVPSRNKRSNGGTPPSSQMIDALRLSFAKSAKYEAPWAFSSAFPTCTIETLSHTMDKTGSLEAMGGSPIWIGRSSPLAEMFRRYWTFAIELSRYRFTFRKSETFVIVMTRLSIPLRLHFFTRPSALSSVFSTSIAICWVGLS